MLGLKKKNAKKPPDNIDLFLKSARENQDADSTD